MSYSLSIVTMAVSIAVCEIFSVKEWCDLENRVRVRSRSLELAPFDRSHTSSCILTQLLTNRKHRQSLEALGHGFFLPRDAYAKHGLCRRKMFVCSQLQHTYSAVFIALQQRSMLMRDIDIANLPVCPSVHPSVTFRYQMKTA